MRLFEWHKQKHVPGLGRPTRYHYWPIRFGWVRNSCHAFICWHGWPIDGSNMRPDASYTDYGWTLHIGAFKIKFGHLKRK